MELKNNILTVKYPWLRSLIFLLAVSISVASSALSQPTFYQTKYLNEDDGLSSNEILSFYNDKYGYIWIGSNRGINKYNSLNVEVFKPEEQQKKGIGIDIVTSIKEDHFGNVWMGLNEGGLYKYDRLKNTFFCMTDSFNLEDRPRSVAEGVSDFVFDEENNLWYGGSS